VTQKNKCKNKIKNVSNLVSIQVVNPKMTLSHDVPSKENVTIMPKKIPTMRIL
jgi:hypothetical protein